MDAASLVPAGACSAEAPNDPSTRNAPDITSGARLHVVFIVALPFGPGVTGRCASGNAGSVPERAIKNFMRLRRNPDAIRAGSPDRFGHDA
jgi:hypothetical protein